MTRKVRSFLSLLGLCWTLSPMPVHACAACFGKSDSPLAEGMNMGILSLLVVVLFVFCGIAAFFLYLVKKSAAVAASNRSATQGPQVPAPPT